MLSFSEGCLAQLCSLVFNLRFPFHIERLKADEEIVEVPLVASFAEDTWSVLGESQNRTL